MASIDHLEIQLPPESDEPLPTIILAKHVLAKIFTASMQHLQHETGEAMVGLEIANGNGKSGKNGNSKKLPKIFVLDTVPPVEHSVRQYAMFEQGDDWQGAIFNWWHENWEMYRELRRNSYGNAIAAKWDAPLKHLGDWHKQPDGMVKPSGGDMRTAKRLMRELKLKHLLMPIVTFEPNFEPLDTPNTLAIATEHQRMRIDFWWVAKRGIDFEPMRPELAVDLPRLPDVVWWLSNSERLDAELALLEQNGFAVLDLVSWSANNLPPLDTVFIIQQPGHNRMWLAVTPAQYPQRAPEWRTAPVLPMPENEDEDFLTAAYAASEPVPLEILPHWTAKTSLLDGVKAILAWEKRNA